MPCQGRGLAVLACRGTGASAVPWWPGRGLCVRRGGAFAQRGGLALRWPALPGPGWPALGGAFAAGASAAVGRAGAFAVVACAGAAGVAAGFSRGQGPGLGSALLAMVRFRGAARGPLPSWPALPGPGWPALGGAFVQRGPGCAVLHGPCCRGAACRGQTTILQI